MKLSSVFLATAVLLVAPKNTFAGSITVFGVTNNMTQQNSGVMGAAIAPFYLITGADSVNVQSIDGTLALTGDASATNLKLFISGIQIGGTIAACPGNDCIFVSLNTFLQANSSYLLEVKADLNAPSGGTVEVIFKDSAVKGQSAGLQVSSSGETDGQVVTVVGSGSPPVDPGDPPTTIPEPGTWLMAASCVILLGKKVTKK